MIFYKKLKGNDKHVNVIHPKSYQLLYVIG